MKLVTKKTIKYLFALLIFSSTLVFNLSYAQAAYSADTLVELTNSERTKNGLGALSTNQALMSAALAKANDMLARDYFAHNSPDGRTPWDFITQSGYNYTYAGENLGIGYTDATELFSAWMASPTHRDNILNPNFREIGIAVVSGDFEAMETMVAVQEFGTSAAANTPEVASQSATPASQTTSTPSQNQTSTSFEFVRDKSEFKPQSIFVGEGIEIVITISGEIKTLEAQVFDQKINLLEGGSVTGNVEKTYSLKQKIGKLGQSEVKIMATDINGNAKTLSLGDLETKETLIVKDTSAKQGGIIAGIKESFSQHQLIYILALAAFVFAIFYVIFKIYKKNRLMAASWRI